jgi:hypothetical protein
VYSAAKRQLTRRRRYSQDQPCPVRAMPSANLLRPILVPARSAFVKASQRSLGYRSPANASFTVFPLPQCVARRWVPAIERSSARGAALPALRIPSCRRRRCADLLPHLARETRIALAVDPFAIRIRSLRRVLSAMRPVVPVKRTQPAPDSPHNAHRKSYWQPVLSAVRRPAIAMSPRSVPARLPSAPTTGLPPQARNAVRTVMSATARNRVMALETAWRAQLSSALRTIIHAP